MTPTHSMTRIFTLLLIILFSSMALAPAIPVTLSPTPGTTTSTPSATRQLESTITPTPDAAQPTPNPFEIQAGHSDWIVTIAILIVVIIIVPMLLKRAEPRGN